MKKKVNPLFMTLVIIILLSLSTWMLYGYLSTRNIEKPSYEVISTKNKSAIADSSTIEIRKYASMLIAETTVNGPYDRAISSGFRNIANYIFGDNSTSSYIAMTSPVVQEPSSEKIAMTTPVLQQENTNETYTISFVMPSKYTMKSIPKPNKSNVQLKEVTDRMLAVISFSGLWTEVKAKKYTKTLKEALSKDGYTYDPTPQYARYNPPWTPPWMRKNEIWLEIID